jgi:hypothetical protein
MKYYIHLPAILVLSVLLSSCILFNTQKHINNPFSAQEFKQATDWYNSIIIDKQSSGKDKAKAHLRLGVLYSHYRNPSLDYDMAMQHVEAHISMLNGTAADDSTMNLRSHLKSITGIDISSIPALQRLDTRNKALAAENAELRKTIKELNELEVELERIRKEIR